MSFIYIVKLGEFASWWEKDFGAFRTPTCYIYFIELWTSMLMNAVHLYYNIFIYKPNNSIFFSVDANYPIENLALFCYHSFRRKETLIISRKGKSGSSCHCLQQYVCVCLLIYINKSAAVSDKLQWAIFCLQHVSVNFNMRYVIMHIYKYNYNKYSRTVSRIVIRIIFSFYLIIKLRLY